MATDANFSCSISMAYRTEPHTDILLFFIVALKHDQESEKAGYLIMIQINGQKVKWNFMQLDVMIMMKYFS